MKIHIPTTEKEFLIEGLLLVKITIMVGLMATYFMPPNHAIIVNGIVNMLWLWKT